MSDRKPCIFPECEKRRSSSEGYCESHIRQWRKYGEVWVLGDREKIRQIKRDQWARLSPEEKARRVSHLTSYAKGRVRSEEHSRRISESLRARWAGGGPNMPPRICRGCEVEFEPNSNHHFYCIPECKTAQARLRRYGLSNQQYLAMLEAQGGACALCATTGKGYNGTKYGLVVDHCHLTGKARGLLCPDCNTALGRFGDDAVRLRAAADYLDRAALIET